MFLFPVNKFRKTVFLKTYLVFFSITCICVASITWLSVKFSTDHIINQSSQSYFSMLSSSKLLLDQRLDAVDKLHFQVIMNEKIWQLIRDNYSASDRIMIMRDISKQLQDLVSLNPMVHSVYFFDRKHEFVLSDTKYTKQDFPDQEMLSLSDINNPTILPPRIVDNEKVISYIRKFNAFSENEGILVINLKYNTFFESLNEMENTSDLRFLLFNKDALYYSNTQTPEGFDAKFFADIIDHKENHAVYNVGGNPYFICKATSDKLNLTCTYILDYSYLVSSAKLISTTILVSFMIVLIFSLVLIYVFSNYLYRPLSKLISDIGKYSNSTGSSKNDYTIIDSAVRSLYQNNSDLQMKFNTALPYLEMYSLHEILEKPVFNREMFDSALNTLGVYFEYSKYTLAVIDLENANWTPEVKLTLESSINPEKDPLKFVLSKTSPSRITLLINTDYNNDTVYSKLLLLKQKLNSSEIELTISLGRQFEDLTQISSYYFEALKQLENKFFIGKNEIIYNQYEYCGTATLLPDEKIMLELVNHVKSQNAEAALDVLKIFLSRNLTDYSHSIEYVKYICFQLCTNLVTNLVQLGVSDTGFEGTGFLMFEKIKKFETIKDLERYLQSIIHSCVEQVKKLKQKQLSDIAQKTVHFIRDHFTTDLSLEQIADAVYLSPNYLSNIFKTETGMTVFEYVTQCRMERARELLSTGEESVKDIAFQVGYNNVQSFIRFFKKYYQATPEQYRKSTGLHSNQAQ